jgi:hypothetical protein
MRPIAVRAGADAVLVQATIRLDWAGPVQRRLRREPIEDVAGGRDQTDKAGHGHACVSCRFAVLGVVFDGSDPHLGVPISHELQSLVPR